MTWQLVEATVIPQQGLGAIGHVLVPEWAWADGVQHRTALLSVDFEFQLNGCSIAKSLEVVLSGFLSKKPGTFQVSRWAGNRFQVAINFRRFKRSHDFPFARRLPR
jgi:hypothetical protein